MSRTKKIAILAIIAMVMTLMPVTLFAATADSTRLAGDGRVETALEICSAGWASADAVVLAPADQANLVDALAAAPLAGQKDAPILLTFKDSLNAAVKAKISALGATTVYVVGAVSSTVAAEVDAIDGVTVEKLTGADRWATADAINAKLTDPAGTFVVGYNAIPDALSVASYAAANDFAIVLTKADGTVNAAKLVGTTTYLVGGTAVVKDYTGATRLGGADRFATNKAVAENLTYSYTKVYVANGLNNHLVDALAVAPLAAKINAFVALTDGTNIAAASVVNEKASSSTVPVAVGGTSVVSDTVLAKIGYVVPDEFKVDSINVVDLMTLEVKVNTPLDKDSAEIIANWDIEEVGVGTATIDDIDMSADGKTVTLEMDAALTNKAYYNVTISVGDAIDEQDGSQVDEDTILKYVKDETKPTVTSSQYMKADDTFTVNFSEVLSDEGTYTVKNGSGINVTADVTGTYTAGTKKMVFDTSAIDDETDLTITIVGAQDLALNYFANNKLEYKFTTGATESKKPTVTAFSQVSSTKVKVTFSEKVGVVGAVALDGVDIGALTNDGEFDTVGDYTVDDTGRIYTIKVAAAALTVDAIYDFTFDATWTDLSGNTLTEVTKTIAIQDDTTAPTVKTTSASGLNVYVTFSEDVALDATVDGTVATPDGFLKTLDGGLLSVDSYDPAKVKIDLSTVIGSVVSGTYTITLTKDMVADTTNANSAKYTISVSLLSDNGNPTVVDQDGVTDGTQVDITDLANGKITVVYSEDMGSSALTLSNYTVDGVAVFKSAFFIGDKKTVELTLKDNAFDTAGLRSFAIDNVKDLAGNLLKNAPYLEDIDFGDTAAPVITSVVLDDAGQITITCDEDVTAYTVDSFKVYAGTELITVNAVDGVADNKIVLTLLPELTATQYAKTITIKPGDDLDLVVDGSGNAMATFTTKTVTK